VVSCWQESKSHLLENFQAVERELSDEAERIKADVDNDAERLKQSLTVNKASQAKHIDSAAETLRAHLSRMQTTMARCQVRTRAQIHRYYLKIYPKMCHKIILSQKL